jgi:hypothetical protein
MDQREMTDAILEGEAELRAAIQAAEQAFMAGDVKHQLGMLWSVLPPNAKEYVKSNNPDQFRQVSDFLKPNQ